MWPLSSRGGGGLSAPNTELPSNISTMVQMQNNKVGAERLLLKCLQPSTELSDQKMRFSYIVSQLNLVLNSVLYLAAFLKSAKFTPVGDEADGCWFSAGLRIRISGQIRVFWSEPDPVS